MARVKGGINAKKRHKKYGHELNFVGKEVSPHLSKQHYQFTSEVIS